MQNRAKTYAQELEEMFEKDAAEQAKLAKDSDDNGSAEKPRTDEKSTPVS